MNALLSLLSQPRWRGGWRLLLVLLVLVISWLAFSPRPPVVLSTGWDKSNHMLAFFTLAFVMRLGFRGHWSLTALSLLGYGVLIELVQSMVPGREADAMDVLADSLGLLPGLLLAMALQRVARRRLAQPDLPGG